MTIDNAKTIDRSEGLQQIKDRHGEKYYMKPQATDEAARLWGVEAQISGTPLNVDTVILLDEGHLFAAVHFSMTGQGHWLVGVSGSYSACGMTYHPSVWACAGYADYEAAWQEAMCRLRRFIIYAAKGRRLKNILAKLAAAENEA